ncbi:hypothetical protein BDF19DRAFT_422765 [Syncephalis fuscata]|nr:hypothetical protein BDF19DRAFT_422765 [Syncephalis fuscata]
MKLSIAVVCTVLVALVASTAMVDAKPTLVRRDGKSQLLTHYSSAYRMLSK